MSECYLCKSKDLKVIQDTLRHNVERKVLRCSSCELNFLEPRKTHLQKYYDSDYRKLYTPVLGQSLNCQELFDISIDYQKERIKEISPYLKKDMKVLDVGCSVGYFLHTLKPLVKECVGIEFNTEHAEYVNEVLKIKVYTESIEKLNFPEETFDMITAYQVFEHVEDPLIFLENLKKYLKPNGVLVLEVPNLNDVLISQVNHQKYQDFWYRDPHVFNYSSHTLKKMTEAAGFKGESKSITRYSLLNHLHWKMTGRPQASVVEGTSVPLYVEGNPKDKSAQEALNSWFAKADEEYRSILKQFDLGSALLYVGRKS